MAVVTFHKKCSHQGVFSGRTEAQGDITQEQASSGGVKALLQSLQSKAACLK